MSSNAPTTDVPRRLRVAFWLLVTLFVGVALIQVAAGTAAAQTNNTTTPTNATYYENESAQVNDSAWFAGHRNVTLDSVVGMATRIGPYIIGTGQPIPGGVGYAGPIILGLVVAGVFLGSVAGTEMGSPAGIVVALVTAYGLIEVGLAPAWTKVVVLMLLGTVAGVVAIRASR